MQNMDASSAHTEQRAPAMKDSSLYKSTQVTLHVYYLFIIAKIY